MESFTRVVDITDEVDHVGVEEMKDEQPEIREEEEESVKWKEHVENNDNISKTPKQKKSYVKKTYVSSSDAEEDERTEKKIVSSGDEHGEEIVPPYSTSEDDVEIISFNEQPPEKKKKKKKAKRKGKIVGPHFENFDVAVPVGEYVDITPLEPLLKYGRVEKGVMKKVLTPGKGTFPPAGSIVSVEHHQLGFLQEDRRIFMDTTKNFLEPNGGAKPERWTFGTNMQIPGLEAGIFTMRPGEKARFKIDWRYAYGERGVKPGPPFIPPKANIFLDVTMFSWKPSSKERNAMSSAEIFEEAKRVKGEGNYCFKEGKWAEANFIYDDVFTCIKLMFHEYLQTEWTAIRKLEAEALNNQSMCYVRMGDYEMAERRARKCLDIVQEDVKALYRLGLSCNEQKKYVEAKKYLKYAICLRPESLTIRDEYNRACRNIKEEALAVKNTWKGAFNRQKRMDGGTKHQQAKLREMDQVNEKLESWKKKSNATKQKKTTEAINYESIAQKSKNINVLLREDAEVPGSKKSQVELDFEKTLLGSVRGKSKIDPLDFKPTGTN